MKYLLWLYVANIVNRIRWFGIVVAKVSLLGLVVEHLIIAGHQKPVYFDIIEHYINLTWLVFALSLVLVFIPSEKFILNVLALYKRDEFMRDSFISKILRLVKYVIKHDLLQMSYRRSIYQSLVNAKRIKWLCMIMYIYDVYKGFSAALRNISYLIVAYFGFVIATWLYVKMTGNSIYYYHTIDESMSLLFAISGFLILKVIFIPSFSVIKSIVIKAIMGVIRHKFRFGELETKLDNKLATYEKESVKNV